MEKRKLPCLRWSVLTQMSYIFSLSNFSYSRGVWVFLLVFFFFLVWGRLIWTDNIRENETVSRSVVSDSLIAWSVALQVSVSMGFSRQEYWTAISFSSGSSWSQGWNPGLRHCRQEGLGCGCAAGRMPGQITFSGGWRPILLPGAHPAWLHQSGLGSQPPWHSRPLVAR